MAKLLLLISLISLPAFSFYKLNDYKEELYEITSQSHYAAGSYSNARRIIMQKVHLKQDNQGYFLEDVYCQKLFRNGVGPGRMPNHTKINIEHTWPQSRFSGAFSRSLQKVDLHHLYPSDSKSNSRRGNVYFSQFGEGSGRSVSSDCKLAKVGRISQTGADGFEPPLKHKGNVARALFYFSVRYKIKIPAYEEFFLRQWHLIDPVDAEEQLRNDVVERHQGNRNPFIDDPQLTDLITDF